MTETTNSEDVQIVSEYLNECGIMVDLHIGKWAGKKGMSFEDLGLPSDIGNVFTKTSMRLVDPNRIAAFSRIEQRMRNLLREESVQVFSNFRYIPWFKFTGVNQDLKNLISEYSDEKVKFLDEYDASLAEQVENVKTASYELYQRSSALQVSYPTIEDYHQFIESKIREYWPSKQEMNDKFYAFMDTCQLMPPGQMGAGNQIVSNDVMASALEEAKKQAETTVQQFIKRAMGELRMRTVEICTHIRGVMKDTGKISERSLNPLREFISRFRDLNFCNDQECDTFLKDLEENFLDDGVNSASMISEDADIWGAFGDMLDDAVLLGKGITDKAASETISNIAGSRVKRKIA